MEPSTEPDDVEVQLRFKAGKAPWAIPGLRHVRGRPHPGDGQSSGSGATAFPSSSGAYWCRGWGKFGAGNRQQQPGDFRRVAFNVARQKTKLLRHGGWAARRSNTPLYSGVLLWEVQDTLMQDIDRHRHRRVSNSAAPGRAPALGGAHQAVKWP